MDHIQYIIIIIMYKGLICTTMKLWHFFIFRAVHMTFPLALLMHSPGTCFPYSSYWPHPPATPTHPPIEQVTHQVWLHAPWWSSSVTWLLWERRWQYSHCFWSPRWPGTGGGASQLQCVHLWQLHEEAYDHTIEKNYLRAAVCEPLVHVINPWHKRP